MKSAWSSVVPSGAETVRLELHRQLPSGVDAHLAGNGSDVGTGIVLAGSRERLASSAWPRRCSSSPSTARQHSPTPAISNSDHRRRPALRARSRPCADGSPRRTAAVPQTGQQVAETLQPASEPAEARDDVGREGHDVTTRDIGQWSQIERDPPDADDEDQHQQDQRTHGSRRSAGGAPAT